MAILFGIILIFLVVVILCISPITKYLIEKYDEKYTGRQITLNWAYVNPFTGYVHFNDLKIYEYKSDSVFFSVKGLSVNFAVLKLFSKTYEVSEVTLDQPHGVIIQNNKSFNFDDLIKRFSPKDSIPKVSKAPVHFNLLNVKINDGDFYYHEKQTPIDYFIKKVDIKSSGLRWDNDTIKTSFSFLPGVGTGDIKGNIVVDLKSTDYSLDAVVQKFNLDIINQYLKDLTNYGSFRATLDATIKAKSNFKDRQKLTTSGVYCVTDFHFGKNKSEDYTSFKKLVIAIKEVDPKRHIYSFDSISLNSPYFKYERYDHLDNVQTIFGQNGSNIKAANAQDAKFNLIIELGKYIRDISKNFLNSPYKVGRLAIYNADLRFNEYSLSEEFSAGLNPLSCIADSIDKNHARANFFLNSGIKPYGKLALALSINPKDSSDFDIQFKLLNIPLSVFNPYMLSYTSFPLDRGTLEFNSMWHVRNGVINSSNHLVLVDPRVTKRVKNKDTKWIPVPLIMAFIRERGNVIDYEIPITGDLRKPKFHIKDIILHLVENIFVKPVTTPYRIEVKNTEKEIEKSLSLRWGVRSVALESNQKKFIEEIVNFLTKNSDAIITVSPEEYILKEKESILLFEAKKKYYLESNHINSRLFNEKDSELVDKMSIKDSTFIRFLNKQVNTTNVFTVQEKCTKLIGQETILKKYDQLRKSRKEMFISYFKEKNLEKQVRFTPDENIIPYNGFSYYKLVYNKFPEDLVKAYEKMNELNNETPRKEYKKEHQKFIRPL